MSWQMKMSYYKHVIHFYHRLWLTFLCLLFFWDGCHTTSALSDPAHKKDSYVKQYWVKDLKKTEKKDVKKDRIT